MGRKRWWQRGTTDDEQKLIMSPINIGTHGAKFRAREDLMRVSDDEETWPRFLGTDDHLTSEKKPWDFERTECRYCGTINSTEKCHKCGNFLKDL